MRRRILLAILLAVAVTAAVLGIPLALVARWQIQSSNQENLAEKARNIAAIVDNQLANGEEIDLDRVRAAVPPSGLLTVRAPGVIEKRYGNDPGSDRIAQSVPIARDGFESVGLVAEK